MSNSTQSSRMLSVKVNYYFLKVLLKRYNLSFSNYFKPSTLDSFSSATTLISVTFLSIVNLILFIYFEDMGGWRWIDQRRTNESIDRNIIHSLFSIPSKEVAQRLPLPHYTSNDASQVFSEHRLL